MRDNIFSNDTVKKGLIFLTAILFLAAIFFSAYKLTESPPVWMDEGVIIQTAKNLAEKAVYGLQVAPNKFVSSGFVTTSYPVIYPIALSFKIFGVGIFQARIVMVIFLLAFLLAAYLLIKKEYGLAVAFFSLALIVSFAPVYGHGKNVLGEIPGLFLLLSSLLFIRKTESEDLNHRKIIYYVAAGVFAGLAMATKPVFLDLLSFSLITGFLIARPNNFFGKRFYVFAGMAIAPLLIFILVHFSGDKFSSIVSNYYGNPDHHPLLPTIKENSLKFFKEFQLVYFALALFAWSASMYLRRTAKSKISFAEIIAFIFSIANFFAFFATLGANRYFFPGQILSIVYLPPSLFYLCESASSRLKINRRAIRFLPYLLLSILILFQFYQTIFHSWVADNYGSKRSADLKEFFSVLPANKIVMFYDIPEAVLFYSGDDYYQYMRFAESVQIGKETVSEIKNKKVDEIITSEKSWKTLKEGADFYKLKKEFDKYQIFEKI
ncbi:MAG: glycosyltransferase family 39 protein [Patescibacteria group bacterium]|nr:glycosyltransferase family 39 protein [Patescibacteria group bacterium]MDE1988291.1 glycosyltransferase family 39 protein [Patescibacteria group bacterium]MDE2218059.1 glycosyltransferase family 39 protein [Patescibacteria group bacterium]